MIQQPERVAALGRSLNDVRERLLNDPRYDLVTRDEPRTPLAKALMRIRDGDVTAGDSLFEAALRSANSDAQRADFLYARASAGLGDRSQLLDGALAYDPAHGPSLYGKAHQFADRVGRRDSTDGRAAYWCLADEYRRVARVVSDERIAHAALRAARAYERAAPPPSSFGGAGWREGDQITVVYGDGETCTTTVR